MNANSRTSAALCCRARSQSRTGRSTSNTRRPAAATSTCCGPSMLCESVSPPDTHCDGARHRQRRRSREPCGPCRPSGGPLGISVKPEGLYCGNVFGQQFLSDEVRGEVPRSYPLVWHVLVMYERPERAVAEVAREEHVGGGGGASHLEIEGLVANAQGFDWRRDDP